MTDAPSDARRFAPATARNRDAILAVLRTAARDVFRRLMDGVDPDLVDAAERTLAAQPGVIAVRSLRMRWLKRLRSSSATMRSRAG